MRISFFELKNLYFALVTTIVPGPASWSYFVPLFLLPLGLLVSPSALSHGQLCAVILPISVAGTIHAWLALGGNDVISTDCLYMTLFLYVFKDPRRDFRRIIWSDSPDAVKAPKDPQGSGYKEHGGLAESKHVTLESYPEVWTGRLKWAMILPQSRPMQEWIVGESGHDGRVIRPFQHPTRVEFMTDICGRLLPVLLVFLPLSRQLAAHDPFFSDPTWSIFDPDGADHNGEGVMATFMRNSLPLFVLRPMAMAMYAYSLLLSLFLPPILFALLLNTLCLMPDHWSPHTWRPHFGPFSAITKHGVRGFWGRWWHQQMRHIVAEPGRWLAAKLGLGDKGWQKTAKYMLICVSAFALSGITHSGMVPARPRFTTVDAGRLRLSLAGFFWVQPIGIAVELFLLEPILRQFPSSMRLLPAMLRVVWTAIFICCSSTFLVLPFGQLGYWNIIPFGILPHEYFI